MKSRHHDQAATEIDPVCGMRVDPKKAAGSSAFSGKTYSFCAPRCKAEFDADPTLYTGAAKPRVESKAPAGAVYTCPMDPEIRQDAPGACPKCGMALEAETITAPATKVDW